MVKSRTKRYAEIKIAVWEKKNLRSENEGTLGIKGAKAPFLFPHNHRKLAFYFRGTLYF